MRKLLSLFAVSSIELGAYILIPNNPTIGWFLVVFGMIVGAILWLYKGKSPAASSNWIRVWKWDAVGVGIFPYRKLISLSEADLIAYEETRETLAARISQETPGGPTSYYAIALVGQGEIPVFGVKPPSRIRIEIPSRDIIGRGSPSDDNSWSYWGDRSPKYIELKIKETDMKKRIKEVRSWR